MQLPRGTFREIKKDEKIRILLLKLEQEQFSGVCTLSSHGGNGVLVYRSGKCILARVMTKYGDAGLEELLKFLDQNGDVALSVLDETQIKLALEFNKPAIVKKSGPVTMMPPQKSYPSPTFPGDAKSPAAKGSHTGTETVIIRPVTPRIRVALPDHTSHQTPPVHTRKPHSQKPGKNECGTAEGETDSTETQTTSFDQDMETIDTMDLEKVTDKIRGDCKTMIKQLDLEHLLER